jgi:ribosome-associated protein
MREVLIRTEPVELYKLLKFEGMASSGGEAKSVIADGQVLVNGQVETRKRKQLVSGDTVEFAGERVQVRLA